MDEFVDGEYEYLELKNWFSVIDFQSRRYSVYETLSNICLRTSSMRQTPSAPILPPE